MNIPGFEEVADQVWRRKGEGRKLAVVGSIHGDETAGAEVIREILHADDRLWNMNPTTIAISVFSYRPQSHPILRMKDLLKHRGQTQQTNAKSRSRDECKRNRRHEHPSTLK